MRVEASKASDSAYSSMSYPLPSVTNILRPSFENVMPVGVDCPHESD